jgi:hypothetical protein
VLATTRPQLRRITLFGDPELFERFSLPAEMRASEAKRDTTRLRGADTVPALHGHLI